MSKWLQTFGISFLGMAKVITLMAITSAVVVSDLRLLLNQVS